MFRQEAIEREAAVRLAAGDKPSTSKDCKKGGVGLERAAGIGSRDLEDAADDERHLRKVPEQCFSVVIKLPFRIYRVSDWCSNA